MGRVDLDMGWSRYRRKRAERKEEERRRMKKLNNYYSKIGIENAPTSIVGQQITDVDFWDAATNGVFNFKICLNNIFQDGNTSQSTIFGQLTVSDEVTFLHIASRDGQEVVASFVADGFSESLSCIDNKGDSALHLAASPGHNGMVEILLRIPNADNKNHSHIDKQLLDGQLVYGESSLQAALRRKSVEILQAITPKKPVLVHDRDEDGHGPLDFASLTGFLEGVDFRQDGLKPDTDAVNTGIDFQKNTHNIDIRQLELWAGRNMRLQSLKDQISAEDHAQMGNDQLMSLEVSTYAQKGNIDEFLDFLSSGTHVSVIYIQKTPLQNTFLHIAASFGNKDLVQFFVHHFPGLHSKKNIRGDTALHVAAAAGHLAVVKILLKLYIDQVKKNSFLDVDIESNNERLVAKLNERVQVNDCGNTPLHEALMNNHGTVAMYLITTKIEDAFFVNKLGESPLYLAVEANNIDYVKNILIASSFHAHRHNLYEEVTKGKSLVHAAITSRNIALLKELTKMKTEVLSITDENEQTPLHCAASTNFAEGVDFILEKYKMDIFEKDSDGFLPIHYASKYGHIGILIKLLQYKLDAREFVNQDGQNILHVAAMYGKHDVVRYILKTPGLELLYNEIDKDGNTPLHLAAKKWHPNVVSCLTWDKRVHLKLLNNEGLTAMDTFEENMKGTVSYRQRLTYITLKSAGVGRAELQKKLKLKRQESAVTEPYNMEDWKDRVNTLMLVSILIATVTFAAGFTMPGGYKDSEPDHGMATLLNKLAFQAFVICDAIGMYSAILVTVTLIWAQLGDPTLTINPLGLALPLLGISLTMMSLAFMTAVYVVISRLVWLSYVVLILGLFFLTCLLVFFTPFTLPHTSENLIARYLSHYSISLLMLVSGSYFDPEVEDNQL
ncbi:protein ACCELERATED CELL DEATH 6 [Daucus carota subsp. sativus]